MQKERKNAKERNVDFLFPKCQTHAYTRFESGCSENSTQNCLQSALRKKIINTLFAGRGRQITYMYFVKEIRKTRRRKEKFVFTYLLEITDTLV